MWNAAAVITILTVVSWIHECQSSSDDCPEGWRYYTAGHCYYVSLDEDTQPAARNSCHSANAELTSITDEQELNFVLRISAHRMDIEYWFGLYKYENKPNSAAYWLDGNPSSYRKDRVFNENVYCVHLRHDGAFWDKSCSRRYRYICKKAAGLRQSATTTLSTTPVGRTSRTTTHSSSTSTTVIINHRSSSISTTDHAPDINGPAVGPATTTPVQRTTNSNVSHSSTKSTVFTSSISTSDNNSLGISDGAIVGITFGMVAVISLIIAIIQCLRKERKRRTVTREGGAQPSPPIVNICCGCINTMNLFQHQPRTDASIRDRGRSSLSNAGQTSTNNSTHELSRRSQLDETGAQQTSVI